MSEETKQGIKSAVLENEYESGERCATKSHEKGSPVVGSFPKMDGHEYSTTGNELSDGLNMGRESESIPVEESPVTRLQEDPVSSPTKSFQSLYSSQSSKEGIKEVKMIPYISPFKETGVVQFEDTLSDEDYKHFDLIYESLLLEGKAGNLTDLAVSMMLAGKPPVWLPVIHGRLKHLIISSKDFLEKMKAK